MKIERTPASDLPLALQLTELEEVLAIRHGLIVWRYVLDLKIENMASKPSTYNQSAGKEVALNLYAELARGERIVSNPADVYMSMLAIRELCTVGDWADNNNPEFIEIMAGLVSLDPEFLQNDVSVARKLHAELPILTF